MSEDYPIFSIRLLRWFCPPHLLEEIEGDLIQKFNRDLKASDAYILRRAKRRLLWNVIRFFRPGIILRNQLSFYTNPSPMLKNYLITSLRHIRKSKVNFTFKLGGLSLALFSFLAISIYVSYQLSFDRYHEDYENVYRVTSERKDNEAIEKYAITPLAIGQLLNQLPEIQSTARIRYANATYLLYNNQVKDCENLIETDSSLFDVLTFQFIKGDKSALKNPNGLVLTRTLAMTIFGTTDVLQKIVAINGQELHEVTAVIEDSQPNSHLFVSAMVPIRAQDELNLNSIVDPVAFSDQSATLYVRFNSPPNELISAKVERLLDQHMHKSIRAEHGFTLAFQPLVNIYLGPPYRHDFSSKGSVVYVYAFSTMGLLLLLVAGINYINLSVADFISRSKETGIRKVLGARSYQLIMQVTLETILFALLSLALAVLMLYLLFPQITQLLDSDLRFNMLLRAEVIGMTVIGLIALLLFASWFPARQFSISSVNQNLKSTTRGYNSRLSRTLLFTQFTVSAVCLCCTLVVGSQINFVHNKELGFDRKNLLVLSMPQELTVQKMQTFRNELKRLSGVMSVSNSSFRIGGGYWKDWYFVEDKDNMRQVELYEVFSDDELFSTLGIPVIKGRTFSANIPSDSGAAFVINETAAHELGWDDPIGKRIYTHPEEKGKWDGTVVGVVADINISSLYNKVRPLVMRLPWQSDYPDNFIYVRYSGEEQLIAKSIEEAYKGVMSGYPLMLRFVDELYNSTHQKETKVFTSLQFGTFVIVLVSMLGIFSMAAYMSMKRMKEFGIRKVLGATQQQIAGLHLGYFVRIVLIANVLSLPVAYWLMKEWLNVFAYRIDLTITPFFLMGGISLALVILSGGYSAWKSGRMNPVDVIKME
jgi:putative ABC transport system permease protein